MTSNWQRTKYEMRCFVIIGLSATGLDLVLYWWWHHYLAFSIAKTLSFLSGSFFVYLANKFFTFKQKEKSTKEMLKFGLLYGSTMAFNVTTNSSAIWLGKRLFPFLWQHSPQVIILFSFLLATGISTVLNFLGQKLWVFSKTHRKSESYLV